MLYKEEIGLIEWSGLLEKSLYNNLCETRQKFNDDLWNKLPSDNLYVKVKNIIIKASNELDEKSDPLRLHCRTQTLEDLYSLLEKEGPDNTSLEVVEKLDKILEKGAPLDYLLIKSREAIQKLFVTSTIAVNIKNYLEVYSLRDGFTEEEKTEWFSYYVAFGSALVQNGQEQERSLTLLESKVLYLVEVEKAIQLFFEKHKLDRTNNILDYTPSIFEVRQRYKQQNSEQLKQSILDLHSMINFLKKSHQDFNVTQNNKKLETPKKAEQDKFYAFFKNCPLISQKSNNNEFRRNNGFY